MTTMTAREFNRDVVRGGVMEAFTGRIMPVDVDVARRAAQLHVADPRSERDAYIAATTGAHDLTVVTRKVAAFRSTGAAVINPWHGAPEVDR